MTIDLYFGSGDTTPVKTIVSTSLSATYLDVGYYKKTDGIADNCCETRSNATPFNGLDPYNPT